MVRRTGSLSEFRHSLESHFRKTYVASSESCCGKLGLINARRNLPRTAIEEIAAMPNLKSVRDYIRNIPDFPREGIQFKDVTTLFTDPRGFRIAVDQLIHPFSGERIDKVAGLEARGFVLAGAVAHQLSAGFVPIRKQGKLPGKTISEPYELEYGQEVMEIHTDALQAGDKVLVVDDLLATGGTAAAGLRLLERLGADIVGCAFIINLVALNGRKKLEELGMRTHFLCDFND